jgi:Flp pilus assembly protein TadB
MIWTPAFIGFLVGLIVVMIGYALTVQKNAIDASFDNLQKSKGFLKYMALLGQETVKVLPQGVMRVSRNHEGAITDRIRRAGNPWGINAIEFIVLKIGFAVVGLGFGAATYYLIYDSVSFIPWYVYVLGFAVLGFFLPDYDLKKKGDARMLEFRKQLPNAIDFLIIESSVVQNMSSSLVAIAPMLEDGLVKNELTIVASDLNAGRTLESSLRAFAERAPSSDIEAFVNVIIQASIMDTDATNALQERARTSREERIAFIDQKLASLSSRIMIYLSPSMILSLVIVSIAPSLTTIMSTFSGSI